MKRTRSLGIALAVTMLAPFPLLAQNGSQGGRTGAMSARLLVEMGSVEYLVTKAEELKLNGDQKTRLEAIGAAWAEATKATREEIRGMLPQRGQAGSRDREAMRERMQAMRPLAEKLAEEDRKSLDEAVKLLDATQQETVKTLLDERRQSARPRRGDRI